MKLLPAYSSAQHTVDDFTGRVVCCDAIELLRMLPSNSIDMVLCDLPYGVTACAWDTVIPIDPMWAELKRVVKQRAAIVLTATQPFTSRLVSSNYEMFRYEWIWDKHMVSNIANARIMPLRCHESVLIFAKCNAAKMTYNYQKRENITGRFGRRSATKSLSIAGKQGLGTNYLDGVGYPKSIIKFMRENNLLGGTVHPTQKPVALFEYLIRTYTVENDIVLDMTCGSGTTAIAARKTGRRFICGDNSPEYVALANTRLANSDPFQATVLPDGMKQLSLFEAVS